MPPVSAPAPYPTNMVTGTWNPPGTAPDRGPELHVAGKIVKRGDTISIHASDSRTLVRYGFEPT